MTVRTYLSGMSTALVIDMRNLATGPGEYRESPETTTARDNGQRRSHMSGPAGRAHNRADRLLRKF